jgi:nitroimidazol reductase NimA-like FMN-containing flavoprotein (pyridoxamine 5'-phosphate oxidase superfamily)
MLIREMSRGECLRVLAGARLARLGCARENQPYVVPVSLAFDEASGCLYGFTTPGQKLEWMRANPLVCVEVDEVAAHDQWVSVIAFGHYEELPEPSGSDGERLRAQERSGKVGEFTPARSADSRQYRGDDEGCDDGRDRAWQVLKTRPTWWEPGCTAWAARANRDPAEPYAPVYYRVRIAHVTGHKATRDARDAISYTAPAPHAGRWGWLRKTLTRVFGGRSKEASSGLRAARPAPEQPKRGVPAGR